MKFLMQKKELNYQIQIYIKIKKKSCYELLDIMVPGLNKMIDWDFNDITGHNKLETINHKKNMDYLYDNAYFLYNEKLSEEIMEKFNVFFLKKPFSPSKYEEGIYKQWVEAIGKERILNIVTPKACIDVMLGAIAVTSGARSMEEYIADMKTRQQTKERIEEVTKALKPYTDKFEQGVIKPVKTVSSGSGGNKNAFCDSYDGKMLKELTEKLILTESLDDAKITYYKTLRALRVKLADSVPSEFLCPLTGEIFFEPYMTCDGQTFERKAIEHWLKNSDISPVTKGKLTSNNILPNLLIKKLVEEFYNANKSLI